MLIKRAREVLAKNERDSISLKSLCATIEELTKRQDDIRNELKSICSDLEELTIKDFEKMSSEFESIISQVETININFKHPYDGFERFLKRLTGDQSRLEQTLGQHRDIFK